LGREKAKILLVEDEKNIRENISMLLSMHDFSVKESSSVEEALSCLGNFFPDIIICDMIMPGGHGHLLLEAIHKTPALSSIPFVFLTAKSEVNDITTGLSSGAADYITKPFKFDQLLSCIKRVLASA
jgi:DNA-binding response OmpR family regulator